jgi:hypothetical protein
MPMLLSTSMKGSLQKEAWPLRYRHALTSSNREAVKVLSLKHLSLQIRNTDPRSPWNTKTTEDRLQAKGYRLQASGRKA